MSSLRFFAGEGEGTNQKFAQDFFLFCFVRCCKYLILWVSIEKFLSDKNVPPASDFIFSRRNLS